MYIAFERVVRPVSFFTGLICLAFFLTGLSAESDSAKSIKRADLTADDLKRVIAVTTPTTDFSTGEVFEVNQGGAGTSLKTVNGDAFSHFTTTISFEDEQDFKLGNALFRKLWVSSPATTQASDGLGPLFNARACQSCHLKDGRGHPPEGDKDATSMFLRLARPADVTQEIRNSGGFFAGSLPDPTYGGQLQDLAVPGLFAEGRMVISYAEREVILNDGTAVSLREPSYSVGALAYGPLHPDTTLSPRIAPPMVGMGLIEAIEAADIRVGADPEDADEDGISGRVALARDKSSWQILTGRFGWKAENASVRQQSASAFAGDIGISSPDEPRHFGDCTENQSECWTYTTGVQARLGNTEAPDPVLGLVTFYSENLAVPARRRVEDGQVLKGKEQFYNAGCVSCHTPKFVTSRNAKHSSHAFQLIWPYSDFLLHDMGDGLADGQPVGVANGNEWRTPPLWGIGLTETVNGHTFFLHDGRARNLTEAILWHGGEAESARDAFADMEKTDRDALLAFLGSL